MGWFRKTVKKIKKGFKKLWKKKWFKALVVVAAVVVGATYFSPAFAAKMPGWIASPVSKIPGAAQAAGSAGAAQVAAGAVPGSTAAAGTTGGSIAAGASQGAGFSASRLGAGIASRAGKLAGGALKGAGKVAAWAEDNPATAGFLGQAALNHQQNSAQEQGRHTPMGYTSSGIGLYQPGGQTQPTQSSPRTQPIEQAPAPRTGEDQVQPNTIAGGILDSLFENRQTREQQSPFGYQRPTYGYT